MTQKARIKYRLFFCHFYSWLPFFYLASFFLPGHLFRPFFCHFYSWPPFRPLSAIFYLVTSSTMAQKARKPFRPFFCQFCYCLPFIHYLIKNKVKATSHLHTLQSIMPECQCVYVVVQDPSLVIGASHKCLSLFLRADIEGLVVDALEGAFDHCVFLLLCL